MNKSIFDYIAENLCGDMKQTALDFANYLQDSRVEFIKATIIGKIKYIICANSMVNMFVLLQSKTRMSLKTIGLYGLRTVMPTKMQMLTIVKKLQRGNMLTTAEIVALAVAEKQKTSSAEFLMMCAVVPSV